jgi:hypothetical protein
MGLAEREGKMSKAGQVHDSFFEAPTYSSDFLCSDDLCPCPGMTSLIPGETGYLYVSQELIGMRRDCLTSGEADRKYERLLNARGSQDGLAVFIDSNVFYPIFMCREAATRRGLDLAIAAADAKHWVATGLVPLRATPKRR